MRGGPLTILGLTLVALLQLTSPALASASAPGAGRGVKGRHRSHNAHLLRALRGVDRVPSAALLRRVAPENPADQLAAIARDVRVEPWLRLRAVSVLPALGAVAARPLARLADAAKLPPRLRWWAVFGWLRLPHAPRPRLARVQRWLRSPVWQVREAAVRGLRGHLTGKATARATRRLLRGHLRRERHATVRAALRHVLRRGRSDIAEKERQHPQKAKPPR